MSGFVSLLVLVVAGFGQNNPVPSINAAYPQAVAPGAGAFTLTVRGANFVPGAVVNWNGSGRSTTFFSAGELHAQITALDVATAGSALITISNPPPGGGLSSSSYATVAIHLPITTLTLGQAHTYSTNLSVPRLFTADLNGDGKLDIVAQGNGLTVLLANSDGSFTRSSSIPLTSEPLGLSFGDFNNDGFMDFLVVLYNTGDAVIALGDGTGKFRQLPAFGRFNSPDQTAVGDFNRDGNLDLIVASQSGFIGAGPEILLGNGDGTFQPQQTITSIFNPYALTPADFNADGILDMALLDEGTNQIAVLLGNGDGTFQPPIETQPGYYQMLLGDFNEDGYLDFVTIGSGAPLPIGIVLGNGDGTFQAPQFYSTGFQAQVPFFCIGDFNADGNTDVLSYGSIGHWAGFLKGNGDGTMQRVFRFTLPGQMFKGLGLAGDFNSDGLVDFAAAIGGGIQVFLQAPQ